MLRMHIWRCGNIHRVNVAGEEFFGAFKSFGSRELLLCLLQLVVVNVGYGRDPQKLVFCEKSRDVRSPVADANDT